MQKFIVTGGMPLRGSVRIAGAKNAVLKLMAAAVLTDEPTVLRNVPKISDVMIMRETMGDIGFKVRRVNGDALEIVGTGADWLFVPLEAAMKMRSSFILLGPLLTRFGQVIISNPGGDRIGRRPVDLHVAAMEALGASIEYKNGYYFARAPQGLRGARIEFPYVTVMGTENALLAAVLARGTTVIENAAREPEVADLAKCLVTMGARIAGAGTDVVTVEGVERLHGGVHDVIPDRIETGTYLVAGAMTRGDVRVRQTDPGLLLAVLEKLREAGAEIEVGTDFLHLRMNGRRPRAVSVRTAPYPAFPTDMQAQFVAMNAVAEGAGTVTETVFENRFMHVQELQRMGADIEMKGNTAFVRGVERLKGAPVMATDLRASASLALAGLVAEGETVVDRIYHIDRGYECIEEKLSQLGARIRRVPGPRTASVEHRVAPPLAKQSA